MNITIADLLRFSENGDGVAQRIVADIKRYSEQKEQQINNEIRSCIGEITTLLSKPESITGRDITVPHAVAEIANEWALLISPVDAETEVVN